MGVQSLGSYMQRKRVFQRYSLRNTKLVIDGKGICHMLMGSSFNGDIYGGNYDTFSHYVQHFFLLLKNCNIECYVVMDGAYDTDNKKISCIINRCEKKILDIANGRRKCFPILAHWSFTDTVKKLGIPIETCNYEADREMAVLARCWKCPLLSNDNDFFIYDLPGGYIRYTDLRFTHDCEVERVTSINTWIYFTENVHLSLEISPSILPLLVAFLDNDFSKMDPVVVKMCLSRILGTTLEIANRHTKKPTIDSVIKMLRFIDNISDGIEFLSDCVNCAEHISAEQKTKMIENANLVTRHFDITETSDDCIYLFSRQTNTCEANDNRCISFPPWLIEKFRNCEVSPFVVDVLSKRVILKPNLEDLRQDYVHSMTSHLRQIMYKLITGKKLQEVIVEHHRVECRMDQTRVFPMTGDLKLGQFPSLDKMPSIEENTRLVFLSKIFQFPTEKLERIPKYSKLFVLALNYFAKNSYLRESIKGIKSFIFSHMLLLWKDQGHIYESPVDQESADQLFRYCADTFRVPFDIQLIHELQRFQTILDILYNFNAMFMNPVVYVNPSVVYKGGLIYPLFTKTDNEQHLDRIIQTCIEPSSVLGKQFDDILSTIVGNL